MTLSVIIVLIALTAFLAGLVCLVRPIRAIRIPTRRRAAWIWTMRHGGPI